jgi:hypothetical protein
VQLWPQALPAPLLRQRWRKPPRSARFHRPPATLRRRPGAWWACRRSKVPLARITLAEVDGARVARLATDASYGTLVHDITPWTPSTSATLAWRWRLDQPLAAADLRRKEGDDAALKLCVMFDLPLDALSFGERTLMRVARTVSGEKLPAATLCYVWDVSLPTGTVLPNAYSRRVRFMVVDGTASAPGPWRSHQRSLAADFLKVFGDDTQQVPPAVAVVIGADCRQHRGPQPGLHRRPEAHALISLAVMVYLNWSGSSES